ncbi:acetyl-CoA carboxylase carboxyltransferase subunit alpha [Candidatus Bipolaricaulota sp. J31]
MVDEGTLKALEDKIAELKKLVQQDGLELAEELSLLERKLEELRREYFSTLSDWDRVKLARHERRPTGIELVEKVFDDFYELRGDRLLGDDQALRGGLAKLGGKPVVVLFHQKGRTLEEQKRYRFGMAGPAGYRKATRLMRMADRLRLPLISLVDTPGAYPGVEAESHNIAGTIARSIETMLSVRVPTVAVIVGEGGSGGAVAIACADRVLMFEYAIYSVISPEGAAAILWKDQKAAPKAAEALGLSAPKLLALGVIDEMLPEPLGGAHTDPDAAAATVREALMRHLGELSSLPLDELLALRYKRYRDVGSYREVEAGSFLQDM